MADVHRFVVTVRLEATHGALNARQAAEALTARLERAGFAIVKDSRVQARYVEPEPAGGAA